MKTADWQKRYLTPLNLHLAGVIAFLVLDIVLGARLGYVWHQARGTAEDQLNAQRNNNKTLNMQNAPLRGLDVKIAKASAAIDTFYDKRIPPNFSAFAAVLGDLANKNKVKLTRVQYSLERGIPTLAEVRMDANLSGDYTSIMEFINGVEREKTFFVIYALTLSGQQGGVVNLRIRVSTYMRPTPELAAAIPAQQGGNQ